MKLTRTSGTCLWGRLFSRLYEQLGLLAGGVTPRAEELLARLASWMPYAPAQELLEELVGVRVSKATARRACAGSLAHLFAKSMLFEERMCHGASTAPFA